MVADLFGSAIATPRSGRRFAPPDGVAPVSAPRLLGHLAEFRSLFRQGELLCTQGLAYLLQNSEAQATFTAWLCLRTGSRRMAPR